MDTRGTSLWHRVTASHGFWDRPRRTGGETGTECPAAPVRVRRPDILGPGRVQPPCSLASCPGGAVTNRPQLGAQNYVRRSFRGPAGRESDREASEGLVRLRLSGEGPRGLLRPRAGSSAASLLLGLSPDLCFRCHVAMAPAGPCGFPPPRTLFPGSRPRRPPRSQTVPPGAAAKAGASRRHSCLLGGHGSPTVETLVGPS